jgi:hypothetical protein
MTAIVAALETRGAEPSPARLGIGAAGLIPHAGQWTPAMLADGRNRPYSI